MGLTLSVDCTYFNKQKSKNDFLVFIFSMAIFTAFYLYTALKSIRHKYRTFETLWVERGYDL